MPAEQSCLPHGRVADFARLVIAERILASLADVFEQPKRVAVIKGIAAAYRLYDDPIERPFVDIDLLTTPRYARTLLDMLLARGWRRQRGSNRRPWRHRWPWVFLDPLSYFANLYHPAFPELSIDLQWRVGLDDIVQGGVGALLADTCTISIGATKVPVLSPADTVVATALWIVRDGFSGTSPRLLMDFERGVDRWFRTDLTSLVQHARRRGLCRVLTAVAAYGCALRGPGSSLEPLLTELIASTGLTGPLEWHRWMPDWHRRGKLWFLAYLLWPDATFRRMRVMEALARGALISSVMRVVGTHRTPTQG